MNKAEKDFHIANHQAMAAHSAEMAEAFSKSADCHADLAKASEMTDPQGSKTHSEISKCHGAMAKSCVAAGQGHLQACEKLASMPINEGKDPSSGIDRGSSDLKAILDRLDKMSGMPAGFRGIPLSDNNRSTIVPRSGQPTAADRVDKSAVEPELREIIFDPRQAIG
jgi:hypothetical protein